MLPFEIVLGRQKFHNTRWWTGVGIWWWLVNGTLRTWTKDPRKKKFRNPVFLVALLDLSHITFWSNDCSWFHSMIVVRFKGYCDVDVFTTRNISVNTETVVCYWWWDWLITENTYPIELDMCDHGHVWPLVTDEYVFLVTHKSLCTSNDIRYVD
jgi:hypothetical protein